MTNNAPSSPAAVIAPGDARALELYRGAVDGYRAASRARNTVRCYASCWRSFSAWCAERGAAPLPAAPELVEAYLASLAEAGAHHGTCRAHMSAIAAYHRAAGVDDPTRAEAVRLVIGGIARQHGTAPRRRVAPVTVEVLRAMLATLDRATLRGRRDAAVLLVGFAGAFRRSELVNLDLRDIQFLEGELRITLRKSKTDQAGRGFVKHIAAADDPALCPILALRVWLEAAGLRQGRVFRAVSRYDAVADRLSSNGIADVIKNAAHAAGLDWRLYSGHSLRRGFITSAAARDVPDREIMAVSGHASSDGLRPYIELLGQDALRAVRRVLSGP